MRLNDKYQVVIGLEVHTQLLTQSKLFCGDSAAFSTDPNTHVSPITLAHPGTLPKMNSKAIENAKANAVSFTKPLGQTVGKAIYILQKNSFNGIPGASSQIRLGLSSQLNYDAKDYNTNIEFEKITISSEIGVRFALE